MRSLRTAPVVLGMLWGAGVMAVQGLAIPSSDGGLVNWSALAWALPGWSVMGIALAFTVEGAERWLRRPAWIVAVVVAASLPLSVLWSFLYSIASEWFVATEWSQARLVDPLGAFTYQVWFLAFYGGGYAFAWNLHRRSVHSREALERIEMAHLARSTRAGAVELERLRSQVDPELMLRTIAESRRRLEAGDASVDTLLSRLVAFLRAAMPAAGRGSTAETNLRYRELIGELERSHEPSR